MQRGPQGLFGARLGLTHKKRINHCRKHAVSRSKYEHTCDCNSKQDVDKSSRAHACPQIDDPANDGNWYECESDGKRVDARRRVKVCTFHPNVEVSRDKKGEYSTRPYCANQESNPCQASCFGHDDPLNESLASPCMQTTVFKVLARTEFRLHPSL